MQMYRKVAFHTLGCKLNFSETSTISRDFEEKGFAKVAFEDSPDVFVINTCSVTENADKKCRYLVRKAMSINPEAFIAIIGCYAQLKPEEIAKIDGVDIVLGANEKFNLPAHIEALNSKPTQAIVKNTSIKAVANFKPAYSLGDRTRSFLKVQDGCDYFCTFCTIPLARGKSRNASVSETVAKAKEIAATSVREVVLTGVNIGDFGQSGEENLFDLVRELDQLEGIDRFRISSIEPNLLTNEIIEFCLKNAKRFTPHFHIPLQSGSNKLLKAMRRKYAVELYQERVSFIKKTEPNACIGVDVIVGFPGETEEDFMETYRFLNNLEISYLHVFTYSERANTTAVKLGDPVPMNVRRERSKQLQILSEKKKRKFYESQQNRTLKTLFEQEELDGYMFGFTDNYVRVKVPYNEKFVNQIIETTLYAFDVDGCVLGKI
jgi:threonylcarbamoyladenosine tRNA methylthiotransferase MtaB